MHVLIGRTGFVGGHIMAAQKFDLAVHRADVGEIAGVKAQLLVCAGLPAEKWRANRDPEADWRNMAELAQVLSSVTAQNAILISSIDVYQPARGVTEDDAPAFNGPDAYGRHRAWFEAFFSARFPQGTVVRLPGLYGTGLRKNLVYDLLHDREEQWIQVPGTATFQYFDVSRTWEFASRAHESPHRLLNIVSEPVSAQEIAEVFGERLRTNGEGPVYDVRSCFARDISGRAFYNFGKDEVLEGIAALRASQ